MFFGDGDRVRCSDRLAEQRVRWGVLVLGYCQMTDHVHLVARPRTRQSLGEATGRTRRICAQYINRLYGRSGHLWQGRFDWCAMGRSHAPVVLRYVERRRGGPEG